MRVTLSECEDHTLSVGIVIKMESGFATFTFTVPQIYKINNTTNFKDYHMIKPYSADVTLPDRFSHALLSNDKLHSLSDNLKVLLVGSRGYLRIVMSYKTQEIFNASFYKNGFSKRGSKLVYDGRDYLNWDISKRIFMEE